MSLRALAIATAFAIVLVASFPADAASTLRSLAQSTGIHFGTAVNADVLKSDTAYARLLAREFNLVTPGNALKFSVVQPERGRFDFARADALVAFAEAHHMQVNGHVLVWDQQLPEWLAQGHFSPDELKAILHEHIRTLVTRYRGRIAMWDVAAEAVGEDGKLRETFWSRGIGPDYLALAFRWAHEADPQARLRYNDYGGEGAGAKSDGIYTLAADLRMHRVPIDAVGLQMHVSLNDAPRPADVRINMKRLAALGLQTDITEMDVMLQLPASAGDLKAQARLYRAMLQTCLAVPQCRSFSTWGVTDRYSWIPEFFPGRGAALLFDASGHAKPAYWSIKRALRTGAFHKRSITAGKKIRVDEA
jgi:endo-1,4-beta-xylanase